MKIFSTIFSFLVSVVAIGQVISPAFIISNSQAGVKVVIEEERTAYKDFKMKSATEYNKQGFPTSKIVMDASGKGARTDYEYTIHEEDSLLEVSLTIEPVMGEKKTEKYIYKFDKGTLWEWTPVEGNESVMTYNHFFYDENWNLIRKEEVKVVGSDSSVTNRERYSVQTDVQNRLALTNYTQYDMNTTYYYDEDGKLMSTSIFDGETRRSTEHRLYNEDGQVELKVNIFNRGGALLGITRYSYQTYRKGKASVFETWMPVQHYESVMQER